MEAINYYYTCKLYKNTSVELIVYRGKEIAFNEVINGNHIGFFKLISTGVFSNHAKYEEAIFKIAHEKGQALVQVLRDNEQCPKRER